MRICDNKSGLMDCGGGCYDSGLLWWINMILHTFGWAIALNVNEEGEITDAFPARVKYRGFGEKENTDGYIRVSKYIKENVDDLVEEAES